MGYLRYLNVWIMCQLCITEIVYLIIFVYQLTGSVATTSSRQNTLFCDRSCSKENNFVFLLLRYTRKLCWRDGIQIVFKVEPLDRIRNCKQIAAHIAMYKHRCHFRAAIRVLFYSWSCYGYSSDIFYCKFS